MSVGPIDLPVFASDSFLQPSPRAASMETKTERNREEGDRRTLR